MSPTEARASRGPRWLRSKKSRWIAASALVLGLTGASVGVASSRSSEPLAAPTPAAGAFGFGSGDGASNARTAPAAGGATGTITSVSPSGFTLTTVTGQKVTVNDSSATTYRDGSSTSESSVVQDEQKVLVLGIVDSTSISASSVTVQTDTTEPSTAATVIGFDRGKPSAETQVGTIPADWSAGQGTLVSGAAASEGAEAALAAYPGGIVDRVVKLSDGDYNVHLIGVNWPHHVFLNSDFQVIGAE